MEFKLDFNQIEQEKCTECHVFAKFYGGVGKGSACMGPKAIEFHQREAKRACPLVILHPDNKVASDIVWIGLSERLHFISDDYITTQLRGVRPSDKIKIYRRAIEALNSEVVLRFMEKARGQARSAAAATRSKPSGSLQSRRRPRPVRTRRH